MPLKSVATNIKLSESTVMEGNNILLPDDIIINILTRLSVKTLLRFQCVCKGWKILIKNPSFITDHLHHSINQNPSILLPLPRCRTDYSHFHSCLLNRDLQLSQVHNTPFIDSLPGARIVGSSNGLVCLQLPFYCSKSRRYPNSMLVWNPATREDRFVPGTIDFRGECNFGFGFSPIADDYKIVRIYGYEDFYDGMNVVRDLTKCVNGVEVYSLRTGSWKKLEIGNLEDVHFYRYDAVTIDGAMFWVGSKEDVDGDGRCHVVVSFDIALEVFTLMAMPTLDSDSRFKLSLFEDKLALLSSTGSYESCSLHLWVIEEGTSASGKRWSFVEKYVSHPYPYILEPVTIWSNEIVGTVLAMPERAREILSEAANDVTNFVLGELQCEVKDDQAVQFALFLINLTTNQAKLFVIDRWAFLHAINYVESLVSVDKEDKDQSKKLGQTKKRKGKGGKAQNIQDEEQKKVCFQLRRSMRKHPQK